VNHSLNTARRKADGLLWPVGCAALVLASALWAFAPLAPPAVAPEPNLELHKKDASATGPELVAFDRAAFRAPLWIAPPAPPPPAPTVAAAPPPPLKLQLLAIIKEDGDQGQVSYRAMVYDPDSDKVMVVASGESIAGRTVESIDQAALRIKDEKGGGARVLTLKTEGGLK
jgi:hypothetical protein